VELQAYLDRIVEMFKTVMKDNLAGIYLHGSLAMGCFHPDRSDVDLLVIAKQPMTTEAKKSIANQILLLDGELPVGRGIELSIVLEAQLTDFVYPTPFEFHYSDYHKERYREDENYICGGFEDSDLAAHFVVTYHRGIALYGEPFPSVCRPIDRKYYMQSILSDVESAADNIGASPVYYVLNLCRVLHYLKEGLVSSKKEGGEWGAQALPAEFRDMVNQCLDQYNGVSEDVQLDRGRLTGFAEYMLAEIAKH
jgi:streptomycin 3"-adenylyltransferase